MQYEYNDGGRIAAGYKGETRDCVTRAIAIATGRPYRDMYEDVNRFAKITPSIGKSSARTGVQKSVTRKYLQHLGWKWTPTMAVGQGCKTHLRADELPKGTIIVSLSRHLSAVVDGVINDTFDPSRDGTRCVYGYYSK